MSTGALIQNILLAKSVLENFLPSYLHFKLLFTLFLAFRVEHEFALLERIPPFSCTLSVCRTNTHLFSQTFRAFAPKMNKIILDCLYESA